MLITRIELVNIKSYRAVSVDLMRGTTAISGSNGAGKTTLVEAIGYALFDYLPYNQAQFVREGEKNGKIIVHLIGSDSRPYTVERRCGSGARWLVFDEEADSRLEQRKDVVDKLHEIFGIDHERCSTLGGSESVSHSQPAHVEPAIPCANSSSAVRVPSGYGARMSHCSVSTANREANIAANPPIPLFTLGC